MGQYFVYLLVFVSCVAALIRPAWGCIAFYFTVLLDPTWNWRWALPEDPGFQKWISGAIIIGSVLHFNQINRLTRPVKFAIFSLLLYFCISIVSAQLTEYPERAEFYLSSFWKQMLVCILSILFIRDAKQLRFLMWACVIAQGYNAFQINLEYLQTGTSRYATLADWGSKGLDNNGYSILTVPIFGFALALGFCEERLPVKLFAFFIAALQVHQVMLMESRGSMMGAILTACLTAYFMPRNATNVTLLVLGITATIALAGPPVVKEFTSSFASDEERDSSAESRFYLWEAGAKIIAAHPLVGVGPGASRYYVPQYYRMESGLTIKALHNVIFEVGAETGIFGLISYITFFFAPLIYVVKNRLYFASAGSKYWLPALAVIAGVPGYFLASMFSSGSLIESSYTLPIIGCVLIRILEAGELDEVPSDDSEPSITPEIAIV